MRTYGAIAEEGGAGGKDYEDPADLSSIGPLAGHL
jgi:hypothetical protein